MSSLLVSAGAQGNTGTTTTSAIDTTGATLLVMVCTYATSASVSDSKSNTWTSLTAQSNTGIFNQIFYVNSATPTVGSGHTFTLTASVSVVTAMAFNLTLASPFDVQTGSSAASGSTIQPGSITPGSNNEIIISGVTGGNTMTTVSIDSGMTIVYQQPLTGGSNYGHGAAYKVQTTAAAINPTWTFANGSTANISSTIASFKGSLTAATNSNFLAFM